MAITLSTVIRKVEHLHNSVNGNARYRIVTDNGSYNTATDSGVAADNWSPDSRTGGIPVVLTLNGRGTVTNITGRTKYDILNDERGRDFFDSFADMAESIRKGYAHIDKLRAISVAGATYVVTRKLDAAEPDEPFYRIVPAYLSEALMPAGFYAEIESDTYGILQAYRYYPEH